jgi:DNA-binding IclR family transcriptional regulator
VDDEAEAPASARRGRIPSEVARPVKGQGGSAHEGDRQFANALSRGLQVLNCFGKGRGQIGGTEIAAMTGLPQPTVWRLCHTLLTLGYLVPAKGDKLKLGIPVLRLGFTVLSNLDAAELARPHLQDLADRCGGAAGLAVRDGPDMRFVQRCESDSQLLMNLRVGSRVPLASSAMGWAYLAGLSETQREALVGEFAGTVRGWSALEGPFRRALADYAGRGFILNTGVFHKGYNTAAAPVMGPDGVPVFALNCGGAASVLTPATLAADIGPRLAELARLLESVE